MPEMLRRTGLVTDLVVQAMRDSFQLILLLPAGSKVRWRHPAGSGPRGSASGGFSSGVPRSN
ncbi:hypothetical protein BVI2075_1680010 [Burkholderia vietnamiensis]|nr:hypothetical protein BVI2075_1680010 [Burkholderia vietnamiensis]